MLIKIRKGRLRSKGKLLERTKKRLSGVPNGVGWKF